jgi:hypothetical protein
MGPDAPFYWDGAHPRLWFPNLPDDGSDGMRELVAAEAELASLLSGFCGIANYSDEMTMDTLPDGRAWFEELDRRHKIVAKYYPQWAAGGAGRGGAPKLLAFVNPCFALNWPHNATPAQLALANKPVPMELWKRQIAELRRRGITPIAFCGLSLVEPIKGHLDELVKGGQR